MGLGPLDSDRVEPFQYKVFCAPIGRILCSKGTRRLHSGTRISLCAELQAIYRHFRTLPHSMSMAQEEKGEASFFKIDRLYNLKRIFILYSPPFKSENGMTGLSRTSGSPTAGKRNPCPTDQCGVS